MSRRRYRWNDETQRLEEVAPDYAPRDASVGPVTDLYMDGARTAEGHDIGSRRKRRDYMRANGLADASDFKGTWAQAAKGREAIRTGEAGRSERREAIARALHQVTTGRR